MPAGVIGRVLAPALLVVAGASFLGAPHAAAATCVEKVTVTFENEDGESREREVCNKWEETTRDDDDAASGGGAVTAPGGGGGGSSACEWEAALVAGVVPTGWVRPRPDGAFETRYLTDCLGYQHMVWVPAGADPSNPVPQVTPQLLIPEAYARARRQLPTPIPRIAPADLAPDGYAFVQIPAFFWVDQGPGQWEPVTATAALAGLSLTMTATPSMLVVVTGDGATLRCPTAPPYREGTDPEEFDGCEHVYTDSSAMAPNGETFEVTVTIVWEISWQASNGESGVMAPLTTSANRDLPVAEIQAVVVDR